MRRLVTIGIGTGNLEHMTIQGINALNRVDVILIPRKGPAKDDLAHLRRAICDRYLANPAKIVEFELPVRNADDPSYRHGVDDWHAAIAQTYRDLLLAQTRDGASIGLLVWGDPSLYDSTLRIVERLQALAGFELQHEVIPGITSIQALAAAHRVPLNTIGNPVQITTGRQLKAGFPAGVDTAVVMLDGGLSFRDVPAEEFDIFWGAYLGTADELLISGRLSHVADAIESTRAAARRRIGWIMDIYLLRRC
ncbi:precorrin-6A synthase (deacetylating) [Mesorhizobium sp. 2RAF21]|uniref:precorrin-6A synthase (deacetylating) n=1 Tax=Mesorhizobium sp. 2RAF21 TaxID=3232995 RepID=UPI003F946A3D